MSLRSFLPVLMVFAAVPASARSADENWPGFRGLNASGVSTSKNPPVHLDAEGAVKWKVETPPGASSPCIWGDRIFLTAFADEKLWTICYDRECGKELWRQPAPAKQIEKFHPSEGSPAASTCVTDGQRVVSYFGSCGLVAYDFAGKQLWTYEQPPATTSFDFGSGTSPILAEGLVAVVRDVTIGSSVFAVDAVTGKERWKTPRTGLSTAFSSPVVVGKGNDALLVVAGSIQMKAYELQTGKERWRLRGLPAGNCTTPVVGDKGRVYFAGWSPGNDPKFQMPTYDNLLNQYDADKDGTLSKEEMAKTFIAGFFDNNDTNHDGLLSRDEWDANIRLMKQGESSVMAIDPVGDGDITKINVIWKQSKGLPYVPSPLLYEGRVFFIRDGGLASAYEASTGRPIYESKRCGPAEKYYASPVAAGGHIYLASLDQGTISVLKAAPGADGKPEVISERTLDERIFATPAIVNDRMYVRTVGHLYCFGSAAK